MKRSIPILLMLFVFYIFLKSPYLLGEPATSGGGEAFITVDKIEVYDGYVVTYTKVRGRGVAGHCGHHRRWIPWENIKYISTFEVDKYQPKGKAENYITDEGAIEEQGPN